MLWSKKITIPPQKTPAEAICAAIQDWKEINISQKTPAEAICEAIQDWKKINLSDREVRFYRDENYWTSSAYKLTDIVKVSASANFVRIVLHGYQEMLIDAEQIFSVKLEPTN